MLNIISLGAGVQSSTMALMAAHGEITPMPDAAIFADTQAEPKAVYEWLDWLEKQLPFPVYRVNNGSLADQAVKMRRSARGYLYSKTDIPFFTKGKNGERGMITYRSCTSDFKIRPMTKKVRQLAGIKRGQKTVGETHWMGISLDEVGRMRESREPWQKLRYPLIEQRIRRGDCLLWMLRHGYPKPPRSACIFCPFHSDLEWRNLKQNYPDDFDSAVRFEREVQFAKAMSDNMQAKPYLHSSLISLDQVDFSTDEDRGQLNMFNNECEGMCGV